MQEFIKKADKFVLRWAHGVDKQTGYKRKKWGVFAVVDGDEYLVTDWLVKKLSAEVARDKFRREAKMKDRQCMTCGRIFTSEGPHNRMCYDCCRRDTGIGVYSVSQQKG